MVLTATFKIRRAKKSMSDYFSLFAYLQRNNSLISHKRLNTCRNNTFQRNKIHINLNKKKLAIMLIKRLAILEHHIKTVHLNYRSECPICSKKFIAKSNVRRHLKGSHGVLDVSSFKIKFKPCPAPVRKTVIKPFPSITSDAVAQKTSKTFGNYLVAKHDLVAGEQVMAASAFAKIEYVSCTATNKCFNCDRWCKDQTKLQCENCIDVFFVAKNAAQTESIVSNATKYSAILIAKKSD